MLSMPPTNTPLDTTRRHFLLAVGGGSAAILAATIAKPAVLPKNSGLPADPVFALIDAHKAAFAEWTEAMNHLSDMDEAIPSELQKGSTYCFQVEIVETDDPRWTAANIRYNDTIIKADTIAIEMLGITPTSLAGLGAILRYAAQHVEDGNMWPDGEQIEDEDEEPKSFLGRDWNFYLLRNLGEAVQKIARSYWHEARRFTPAGFSLNPKKELIEAVEK
jgi:hypothetical protein